MSPINTGTSAAEQVRGDVLRAIDRYGPLTVAELPGRWPVTRQHLRNVLRELSADGLVRLTDGPARCGSYVLTERGRAALEEIDWMAAAVVDRW